MADALKFLAHFEAENPPNSQPQTKIDVSRGERAKRRSKGLLKMKEHNIPPTASIKTLHRDMIMIKSDSTKKSSNSTIA